MGWEMLHSSAKWGRQLLMVHMDNHLVGDPLGTHRVLEPQGALPQMAWRLDNDVSRVFSNEVVLDVEALSIDAASFRQMDMSAAGDERGIMRSVTRTVRSRGKQHNPVTGTGGVLMGKVLAIGVDAAEVAPTVGERIVSLASLTVTPLRLEKIRRVHRAASQLEIKGQAVMCHTYPFAVVPESMEPRLALAMWSVCAAPALVQRLTHPGQNVLIYGAGGKSGVLCAYVARQRIGKEGKLFGVDISEAAASELRALGLCDEVVVRDGSDFLSGRELSSRIGLDKGFDVVLSCVSAGEVEMGAILATCTGGKVCFFSSQTSITRAVFGAQAACQDVALVMGGGYVEGQAQLVLNVFHECPAIRNLFAERYL